MQIYAVVDMDDLVFYEVAMEKHDDDAFLVTGNLKHYPVKDFIVTPAEMLRILFSYKRQHLVHTRWCRILLERVIY